MKKNLLKQQESNMTSSFPLRQLPSLFLFPTVSDLGPDNTTYVPVQQHCCRSVGL